MEALSEDVLEERARGERISNSNTSLVHEKEKRRKATPDPEPQANKPNLCNWCSGIVWERPPPVTSWRLHPICTLHETVEELLTSNCRICRILGMSVSQPYEAIPPIKVGWEGRDRIKLESDEYRLKKGYSDDFDPYIYFRESREHYQEARTTHVYLQTYLIQRWLQKCRDTHGKCTPSRKDALPGLKVIDCHQCCVVLAPASCSYVALSYVWGQAIKNQETDPGISDLNLPQTIKDSINVTLLLGYRYLWIDRYCINQKNAQEQQQQIQQMGTIYSSAQVTIVAAAGSNPSFGLPGISRARRLLDTCEPVDTGYLFSQMSRVDKMIAQTPWATRAWTFQEGFLSKRRLFFTDKELFYVCEKDFCCESDSKLDWGNMSDGRNCIPPGIAGAPKVRSRDIIPPAEYILMTYTERYLSHDEDALNAVVGALNTLSTKSRPTYHIWGVPVWPPTRSSWMQSFGARKSSRGTRFGILWSHDVRCRRRVGFPSWSPLGWEGEIHMWRPNIMNITGDTIIQVWWNKTYHDLHTLVCGIPNLQELSSTKGSEILRITARTVPFEKQLFVQPVGGPIFGDPSRKIWFIRIHVDQDTDIVLFPEWDLLGNHVKSGICCLFNKRILVLDECGEFYERSGISRIGDFAFIVEKDAAPPMGSPFEDFKKRVTPALRKVARRQTFLLR